MGLLLSPPAWDAALGGLAWTLGAAVLTWMASLVRRDASLVDRMWSALVAGAGLAYTLWFPPWHSGGAAPWILGLSVLWALRLGVFITLRNWGHGEDRRYQAIRERNQPHFGIKSLVFVFGLQALLAWIVSAPLLAALLSPGTEPPWKALPGLALAAFGLVFEAVGDAQMARFKRKGAHEGRVMDQGLWRYTRHPNYFGEACVWWGLWGAAMGTAGWSAGWSVVSPLLMTVLLLRVSGVTLLEKDIAERRPAYRDYQMRTSAFVPWPPRKEGQP
ncbi:DUF1295 domain-containing protein [Acidovorax sp. NCPPB 2350]|nr:DUF1295 domain-containing protein [Acidovorax sp. NCPPB 2350]